MELNKRTNFRVNSYLVQPRLGAISIDGTDKHIEPKIMEVLVCLVERAGEVVSKEQLLQIVWADTFVSEQVLKVAVSELRKALSDDAREPRFIQTIPKQGYRLIAEVAFDEFDSQLESKKISPVLNNRFGGYAAIAAAITILTLAVIIWKAIDRQNQSAALRHPNAIAVLPLKNLSGNPDEEFFAEGITETLITELARTSSAKVISRTTAMQFKSTSKSIPEIADELKVDAVIEGSVFRTGERVRITVQLIDGVTDQHLWTQKYDYEVNDILSLQNLVASEIAGQISTQLTPGAKLQASPEINSEAYEAYLKGRFFWNKRDRESLLKSITYFEKTLQLEPDFLPAYTGLADAYNYLGTFGYAAKNEAFPKAQAAALQALKLNANSSEAHAALAYNLMYNDWNWAAAEGEFQKAIALDDGRAITHHWAANLYSILGRHEEAIFESQKAHALDPLSPNVNSDLSWYYYFARRFDEAIKQCKRTLEIEPVSSSMYLCLQLCYQFKDQPEAAMQELQKSLMQMHLSESEIERYQETFAKSNLPGTWQLTVRQIEKNAEQTKRRAYTLTIGHAFLDNRDRAMVLLEQVVKDREGWAPFIAVDPAFDKLHQDSRFQSLIQRMNL